MSAKHTPGPWERVDNTVYALTENRRQNRFWASVQSAGRPEQGEAGKEECDANARLIAAAPDLLAVAEDTAQHIAAPLEKRDAAWHAEGVRIAERNRAAIAKARGES